VQKRQKDQDREHIFVRLPDDTACGLPSWMFSPACAEHIVGAPVIAIDALLELRDLLTALRSKPECDKPSLKPLPMEGQDEISAEAASTATQSATAGSDTDRDTNRKGRRGGSRPGHC
jgi:hypothetical protein